MRAQANPDREWRRIRKTEAAVVNAVGSFARKRLSKDLLAGAWREFTAGSTIPEEHLVESIFIPWFVFSWIPGHAPEPLALTYLAEHASSIDDYQKSFIQEACAEPFTFFLVTAVVPGRSLTLRDLLLEREVTVKERQATEILKRGHIIYARCLSLAGQSILTGTGPIPLPPDAQCPLLDLRDDLKKTAGKKGRLDPASLRSEESFLRSHYFDAADQVMNPAPPVVQNTDGDPLEIIRLRYQMRCSPEQAVENLKTLVLPEFQENILETAEFDGSGRLTRAFITWQKRGNRRHPEWDNTSLGQIEIRRDALEIEVNSEKRARKIRREIQDRLGDQCAFETEERQTTDARLRAQEDPGAVGRERRPRADERTPMPPELRAALNQHMKAHWDAWLDVPIPALRNQTPRHAARTPQGRERLEALLMEFEYRNESMIQPELCPNVAELRRKLGLPG
jgi:hypothetical protein